MSEWARDWKDWDVAVTREVSLHPNNDPFVHLNRLQWLATKTLAEEVVRIVGFLPPNLQVSGKIVESRFTTETYQVKASFFDRVFLGIKTVSRKRTVVTYTFMYRTHGEMQVPVLPDLKPEWH